MEETSDQAQLPTSNGIEGQSEDTHHLRCFCGKSVQLWSGLLEQGFCSEDHYEEGKTK